MSSRPAPSINTVHFALPTDAAGLCLQQVRAHPGITRTELQRSLHLSQPTIHRLVTRLTDEGILSATTTATNATGRPSSSLTVDGRAHLATGAHIGLRRTQLVLTDIAGRTLAHDSFPLFLDATPPHEALPFVLGRLSHLVKGHLGQAAPAAAEAQAASGTGTAERTAAGPARPAQLRSIGLAFSTDVLANGVLESPIPAWDGIHLPTEVQRALHDLPSALPLDHTLPISLGTGVSALAGMELAFRDPTVSPTQSSSILYVYSREVLSYSWIIHGGIHRPRVGHQSALISALLAQSRLAVSDASASDKNQGEQTSTSGRQDPLSVGRLLDVAAEMGHPAASLEELVRAARTNAKAAELLDERTDLLGKLIDIAAQVTDPDEVVLAGETFSADPERTRRLAQWLNRNASERILKAHPAHPHATLDAVKMVALHPLWQSPV
ncbi:ROK family transcriptional regulator [Corynebacterium sp. 320]|uniref:ROK family transcriptional regulator n=1 Tax=Corynebacterium TaxID=1716 RepID=UPI00125CB7C2|nr:MULTISPECIES: winged helix-turn-helix transcriptional regulator [Corynebacterium]KAB1503148.1 ROK family transcriptional regulator [Corynebacterium sp. 320]KAB1550638.1 ROK family transcriptional regulator [Corynebacterium sp. 321]KAB1551000.1 ROK family transcriptional regulator [Corynebacterium sp. 319]KAB3526945.1 ROK family transcriptional regulator [Corynebacterium sp. 250]KAB3538438.1 ROK family transcriptional regulator [Corynebacterium sp. 366]